GHTAPPAGTAGPTAARVDDDAVTSTYDVRQAERSRPVPAPEEEQPTLSEHRSAAYLTGERAPEPARTPDPREDAADRRRSPEEEAAREIGRASSRERLHTATLPVTVRCDDVQADCL